MAVCGPIWGREKGWGSRFENRGKTSTKKITTKSGKANGSRGRLMKGLRNGCGVGKTATKEEAKD